MRTLLLAVAMTAAPLGLAAEPDRPTSPDAAGVPPAEYCASPEGRDSRECRLRASREAAQEAMRENRLRAVDPVRNPAITAPPPPPAPTAP